jgi:hypothetical protein
MENAERQRLEKSALGFERYLRAAIEQKWPRLHPRMRGHLLSTWEQTPWNVAQFLHTYNLSLWPADRLPKLIAMAKDVRLQFYYLTEVDLGLYNHLYHDPINDHPRLAGTERFTLLRQSLDQSLIGKSRVLWERILTMVFFMETGREIRDRRRTQEVFKTITADNPRWGWLNAYRTLIKQYDSEYRTPEFHTGSRLRMELDGRPAPDPNDLLALVNANMNAVWQNVLQVAQGGQTFAFTSVHMTIDAGEPAERSTARLARQRTVAATRAAA